MVVTIKVGRRIPRNFFKGVAYRAAGLFTFQENMWQIITRALQMAKSACDDKPEEQIIITMQNKEEDDGLHYKFQWKIMNISSIFPEKEKAEYDVFMTLYDKVGAIRKVLDMKVEANADMSRAVRDSKVMSEAQYDEAKSAGYGALKNKDIASKLLEMGIITHIEWKPDKEARGLVKE